LDSSPGSRTSPGPFWNSGPGRFLRSRLQLVDEMRRHGVVVRVLHREATAPTGDRTQIDRVAQHFGRRHQRDDLDFTATCRARALDATALRIEVAHDVAL